MAIIYSLLLVPGSMLELSKQFVRWMDRWKGDGWMDE